jgi:hypothetical protein
MRKMTIAVMLATFAMIARGEMPAVTHTPHDTAARPPAITSQALSVSPAVARLSGKFGQSASVPLQLTNETSELLEFSLVAEDVIIRNGERTFVPAGELPHSIAATVLFNPSTVRVPPGGTASVQATVTVPPDTEVRAIGAFFRSPKRFVLGGRTGARIAIGSLITFTLTNHFEATSAPAQVTGQSDTTNLTLAKILENTGSEPIVPAGILAVVDKSSGRMIGKATIEPRRLLPGERIEFVAEYGSRLRPGMYRTVLSFEYEGKALTDVSEVEIK